MTTEHMNGDLMTIALEEAQAAAKRHEVPVGVVLVDARGEILSQTGNRIVELHDPTSPAGKNPLRT